MKACGRARAEERGEPAEDSGDQREDAPQLQPEQVRSGEQAAKEHGQAAATQLTTLLEADRMLVRGQLGERCLRVAVGVAIGEQQRIRPELRAVAEPVGGAVA